MTEFDIRKFVEENGKFATSIIAVTVDVEAMYDELLQYTDDVEFPKSEVDEGDLTDYIDDALVTRLNEMTQRDIQKEVQIEFHD